MAKASSSSESHWQDEERFFANENSTVCARTRSTMPIILTLHVKQVVAVLNTVFFQNM